MEIPRDQQWWSEAALTWITPQSRLLGKISLWHEPMYLYINRTQSGQSSWDHTIYVGDMANCFHSLTLRGRKNFVIQMPCPIQDLEVMPLRRHRVPHVVLVGLSNGQIHMYNEKWLVSTLDVHGPVRALRCGAYGREENALVRISC